MMGKRYLIFTVFFCFSILSHSQEYEIGQSYFSPNEYVQYIHGNLPLILSAPHGGEKEPNEIPDRDCPNCVTLNDAFTQELTNELTAEIIELTGCYPHVIINRLHRSKLDANRGLVEGASGNDIAEIAWIAYHDFIKFARDNVSDISSKGLFLDLHGHGHDIQRLELGYLLSKSNLALNDSDLNSDEFIEKSSIKHLVNFNLEELNLAELIRGESALGSILETSEYPSVPSDVDESPLTDEPYFSGGYNTQQYGSRSGGTIDAIQIECNQDVRFEANERQTFAANLAQAIIAFMENHYFETTLTNACSVNTIDQNTQNYVSVFPNPMFDLLHISSETRIDKLRIFDSLGNLIYHQNTIDLEANIDLSHLLPGFYFSEVKLANGFRQLNTFIKN